ncbi:MAG: hypothetical protein JRF62_11595 [Deltaproteobacteria bacterium]|nr:hypothetical protein [Deltaproteobacteria bacterium]
MIRNRNNKYSNLTKFINGIPVPPGFTVTTEACNAYLAAGGTFPEGLRDQIAKARFYPGLIIFWLPSTVKSGLLLILPIMYLVFQSIKSSS